MKLEPVRLNQFAADIKEDEAAETKRKLKEAPPGTRYLCPNCLHATVCLLAAECERIGAQVNVCAHYFPMEELEPETAPPTAVDRPPDSEK